MHVVTILAYVCLFWRAAGAVGPVNGPLVQAPWAALLIALVQPALLWLAAMWTARRAANLVRRHAVSQAQHFYHWTNLALRTGLIVGFAFSVLETSWPSFFNFRRVTPGLQILGDLVTLLPFFIGAILIWVGTFPTERSTRVAAIPAGHGSVSWNLRTNLEFNVRHHLLVVAVPMTIILLAADITDGYGHFLRAQTGWTFAPDAALALAAAIVFLVSPSMLRRIWRTAPLEAGLLRERLERVCHRIGLRVRDILVWKSDGMMINAAVMGVLPSIRYVLLSDALIAVMTPRQVEAVFCHEAGHVRHHHIPYFLVLALAGWIGAAAVMELLSYIASATQDEPGRWIETIQTVGLLITLIFWGVGFGWVSRRFERQADLFAAQCAAPPSGECVTPCGVHPDAVTTLPQDGRVCSSGAEIFASALERVAHLSGVPRDEPSWRHSSIGSRIRFLLSLAGDPRRVERFDRVIRRIKLVTFGLAVLGTAGSIGYWCVAPQPALIQIPTARDP